MNDSERDACRACSFTTVTEPETDDRAIRWARAVALGGVGIVVGLAVLVVGVRQVTTSLVPVPVVAGLAVAMVGMNLAVDSLDW